MSIIFGSLGGWGSLGFTDITVRGHVVGCRRYFRCRSDILGGQREQQADAAGASIVAFIRGNQATWPVRPVLFVELLPNGKSVKPKSDLL